MQSESRSSKARCGNYLHRPSPRKIGRRRYRSNSKFLSKNRFATTPPSFQSGSRRKSRTSRRKFYNVLHTLPELRGRRDRIQSFLTTRRHTRGSTSLLCGVYGAQARLWQLSCSVRLSSGCANAMNLVQPTGSRSIGPVSEETTCLRTLRWEEQTTTAESRADGTA